MSQIQTTKGRRNPIATSLRSPSKRPQVVPDKRSSLLLRAEKRERNL
jgi:hypothetical protein